QIAALELDLLYFTDIGMDLASYFLAFSRLAPVQCMTWGHPVTSGLSTVDYFISSEALESVGSEGQYAEALVRLDGPLSVSYPRPPAPQPVTHSELGIDAERRVYLCPQTLFKFHPEFDRALRAILRADSQAVLVLLRPKVPRWGEIKCEQICGGDRSLAERIRFAPPLARERFLGLFALADVVLDPFHFGGGNTTLEALHSGAVVVTLPSAMLRGRISRACYLALGIGDCLAESAEDYVALAIGLAKDRVRRGALQAQIAARVDQLFDQRGPIAAHENFFVEAHRRAVASAGVAER
ncbi:MAG: hypothetical protein KDA89_25695, partial [Planctomycetaceae bacterium]|nr:hypothetical protein [Planctomycetaceae bacterium]